MKHRQEQILAELIRFQHEHGRMPTMKELCGSISLSHVVMRRHLIKMAERGVIVRWPTGTLPIKLRAAEIGGA